MRMSDHKHRVGVVCECGLDFDEHLIAQATQIAALEAEVNPRPCQNCEGSECEECGGSGFRCVGCATYSRAADVWQWMLQNLEAEVERLRAYGISLITAAHEDQQNALAPFVALALAIEKCLGGRGAFSCCEQHDVRCPKSRAASPEDWKGEWVCVCGAEELDAALAHPSIQRAIEK